MNLARLLIYMFTRWHKSTDWASTLVFGELESQTLTCLMDLLQLFLFNVSCYFFIVEEGFLLRLLHSTEFLLILAIFINFILIFVIWFGIVVTRGAQNTFLMLLLNLLSPPRCLRWLSRGRTLHQLILHLSGWLSLSVATWSLASRCSL